MSESRLVGVSSWAVHRALGAPPIFGVAAGEKVPVVETAGAMLSLLELPGELARRGFDVLQICHFHLPTRDNAYLAELAAAVKESGVRLHALLADEGDITHPTEGEANVAWVAGWLEVAAQLGAEEVRVIGGKTKDAGAIERSVAALTMLAERGKDLGVGVTTENWFAVLSSPGAVAEVLERCAGQVRFLLDFSNWAGEGKYENLAGIAPFASSCHTQATFLGAEAIDTVDFDRCLGLPYPAEFRGPYVLVNTGSGEKPWEGLELLRDYIRGFGR